MKIRRTESIIESDWLDLPSAVSFAPSDLATEDERVFSGSCLQPLAMSPCESGVVLVYRIEQDDDAGPHDDEDLDEDLGTWGRTQLRQARMVILTHDLEIQRGPYPLVHSCSPQRSRWAVATNGDAVAVIMGTGGDGDSMLGILSSGGESVQHSVMHGVIRDVRGCGPAFVGLDADGEPFGSVFDGRSPLADAPPRLGLEDRWLAPADGIEAFCLQPGGYALLLRAAGGEPHLQLLLLDPNLSVRADPVVLESHRSYSHYLPQGGEHSLLIDVCEDVGEDQRRSCVIRHVRNQDGQVTEPVIEGQLPFGETLAALPGEVFKHGGPSGFVALDSLALVSPDEPVPPRTLIAARFDGDGRRLGATVEVSDDGERDHGQPMTACLRDGSLLVVSPADRGELELRVVRPAEPAGGEDPADAHEELIDLSAAGLRGQAPALAAPTSVSAPDSWQVALAQRSSADGEPANYDIRSRLVAGQWLDHPRFGAGLVLEVRGSRSARVLFRDGERTLACGRR